MEKLSGNPPRTFPRKLVTDGWLKAFDQNGSGRLKTLTNSMRPLIQAGDTVTIQKTTSPPLIGTGDIIAFWRGNMLITHRMVRKVRKNGMFWFMERGDRVPHTAWVKEGSVIGIVTKIHRKETIVDLRTNKKKIYGRIIGFVFCSEWLLRRCGRRITGPFASLKPAGKHVYGVVTSLLHKLILKG